jgi:thiosulfate/3-mercaptopyruvate sulfurtransferase
VSDGSLLATVDWLAAHSSDPRVRIVDVRWYLGGRRTGAEEFARGHIPGALFVDVDSELAGPKGDGPGRHPLPSPERFAATLSRLGVNADTIVVAYDDVGGAMAARMWWLLRWFGHGGGRVLDGGIGAWTASGHPLSTETTAVHPAPALPLRARTTAVVDKAAVDAMRRQPGVVLLDARAAERYQGLVEPVDARAGHVPGARSAPFTENLTAPAGRFLDDTALRAHYAALGALDGRVVCYCGSGVTACHDLLALALIGKDDALLYEGSWSDWAADASLPVAVGPDPG